MMRRAFHATALAILSAFGVAVPTIGQQVGPSSGSLLIVGGGLDSSIVTAFFELAGGLDQPIVVIPTAGGADDYDDSWRGLAWFSRAGATDVTLLHTYDRHEADSDEFVAPLRRARGVWFAGGRQWRLVDAYAGTRVEIELSNVLARGGVIGGSSAGATIQGSYLVRGDTRTNTIMMGDHEVGFGYLKKTAIDQHLLRRNRHFDLLEVIEARPELLGIGLDERTAIIVRGDTADVVGQSYVAIYDHARLLGERGQFYFLAPGDRFDLNTRQATRAGPGANPFARVSERAWPDR